MFKSKSHLKKDKDNEFKKKRAWIMMNFKVKKLSKMNLENTVNN